MTFQKFILTTKPTADPVGDLIRGFRYEYERKVPVHFKTLAELRGYLESCGANRKQLDAARGAFNRYMSQKIRLELV